MSTQRTPLKRSKAKGSSATATTGSKTAGAPKTLATDTARVTRSSKKKSDQRDPPTGGSNSTASLDKHNGSSDPENDYSVEETDGTTGRVTSATKRRTKKGRGVELRFPSDEPFPPTIDASTLDAVISTWAMVVSDEGDDDDQAVISLLDGAPMHELQVEPILRAVPLKTLAKCKAITLRIIETALDLKLTKLCATGDEQAYAEEIFKALTKSRQLMEENSPQGSDAESKYSDEDSLIVDHEAGTIVPISVLLDSLPAPSPSKIDELARLRGVLAFYPLGDFADLSDDYLRMIITRCGTKAKGGKKAKRSALMSLVRKLLLDRNVNTDHPLETQANGYIDLFEAGAAPPGVGDVVKGAIALHKDGIFKAEHYGKLSKRQQLAMLWASGKTTPVTPTELTHGLDRLIRHIVNHVKAYSLIGDIEVSRNVGKRPPLSHDTKVPTKPPLKRTRGGRPSWTHEFAAADRRADAYGGLREDAPKNLETNSSDDDDSLPDLTRRAPKPSVRAPKHKSKKEKHQRRDRRRKYDSSSDSSSPSSSSSDSSDGSSSSTSDSDSSSDDDSDDRPRRKRGATKKPKKSKKSKKRKSRHHKQGKGQGRLHLSGASFPGAWNREVMRKVLKTMMRRNLVTAKAQKKGWGVDRKHRRQPDTDEYISPKQLRTLAGHQGLGVMTMQAAVRSSQLYRDAAEPKSPYRHSAREYLTIAAALDHLFTDPALSPKAVDGLIDLLEINLRRARCLLQHYSQTSGLNRSSTKADWAVAEGLESAVTIDDLANTDDADLLASQKSVELSRKLEIQEEAVGRPGFAVCRHINTSQLATATTVPDPIGGVDLCAPHEDKRESDSKPPKPKDVTPTTTLSDDRHLIAVRTFAGLCLMSGPKPGLKVGTWAKCQGRAFRQIRRLRHARHAAKGATAPPRWACRLFDVCEIVTHTRKPALWSLCANTAQRYLVSLDSRVNLHQEDDAALDLSSDSYTIAAASKAQVYRPLVVNKVALPEQGTQAVDLTSKLEWPYNILFSDEVLLRCRRTDEELAALGPSPKGHVAMDKGESYGDLLLRLEACGMIKLLTQAEAPPGPTNGLFGVAKGVDKIRLILDGQPGNHQWCQMKLQREYLSIIASDPARAAAAGLDQRLMPMPDAGDFVEAPPGAHSIGESDFSSYFYTLLQLPLMTGSQRLPAVSGHDIGRGNTTYIPVMQVMSMGSWISAQLAQIIHRQVMRCQVEKPLFLLRPEDQALARRQLFASLGNDDLITIKDLPQGLIDEYDKCGHPGLGKLPQDLRVPRKAFLLEATPDTSTKEAKLEMHTLCFTTGQQMAFAIEEAKLRRESTGREQFVALCSLFIDDNASLYYGASITGGRVAKDNWDSATASLHHLLSIAASADYGLKQAYDKLKWPDATPGKALGIDYRFLSDGRLEFQVNATKRQRTSNHLTAIAYSKDKYVAEDLLDSVLGNYVWQALCRRPFLSALRVVYKARHSPNRPPGKILLTDALRTELLVTSLLGPVLWTETVNTSPVLTTYDASGASEHGNGGFGVAYRTGLTSLAAAELRYSLGGQLGKLVAYREESPGQPPADRLALLGAHLEAAAQTSSLLSHDWEAAKGPWLPAQRGQFKVAPDFIAIGEIITGAMAAKTATRLKGRLNLRHVIGGDNTVASTCLHKGRSSTPSLNNACRRVAVLGYCKGSYFSWFWIPSKTNPADGPSRWWYDDPREGIRRDRHGRIDRSLPNRQRREWVRDLTMDGDVHPHPGPPHRKKRHRYEGARHTVEDNEEALMDKVGEAFLHAKSVSGLTRAHYLDAYSGLRCFIDEKCHNYSTMADCLVGYVSYFHRHNLPKGTAKAALTCVTWLDPEVKARGTLTLAWKAISGWDETVPVQNRLPIAKEICDLLALTLLEEARRTKDHEPHHVGVAMLFCFDTYMRMTATSQLRVRDISLPGDVGTFSQTHGLVHSLHQPRKVGSEEPRRNKKKRNQGITLDNPDILLIMTAFVKGRSPAEKLFDVTNVAKFTKWLKWAQSQVGFDEVIYTWHGLRGGGATHDFHNKLRTFFDVKTRGDWEDDKTCKRYLNQGQALMIAERLPQQVHDWFATDKNKARRRLLRIFA